MNETTTQQSSFTPEVLIPEESLFSKGLACIAYAIGVTGFCILPAVVWVVYRWAF